MRVRDRTKTERAERLSRTSRVRITAAVLGIGATLLVFTAMPGCTERDPEPGVPLPGGVPSREGSPRDSAASGEPGAGGAGAVTDGSSGSEESVAPGPVPATGPGDGGLPGLPINGDIEVDVGAGEIRVPCLFVNPTQLLEVFACHWNGPAHETVVAFLARGPELHDALVRLGLRPAGFWNATPRSARGKPDIRYTLGDRVAIFLRWRSGETPREVAAEKLLREADSGLSPFVRGFTFDGGEVLVGDPPERKVPDHVEITMGGLSRGQKALSSILFHPHDVRDLTHWMAPLEIDPAVVPDLDELVESRQPCTLVIRKAGSETGLLEMAVAQESDTNRRELLESLRPIAEEIDGLKRGYVRHVERILGFLETGDAGGEQTELVGIARQIRDEQRGAELAVLRIWKLYLDMYVAQERQKLETITGRQEIDPRRLAEIRSRHLRFEFEPRIAAQELAIAEFVDSHPEPSEADRLRLEALRHELERLVFDSRLPLDRHELLVVREKLEALDPDEDAYTIRLQREYEQDVLASILFAESKAKELETRVEECEARARGDWLQIREETLARRGRALKGQELARLRQQLTELERDIRWDENFLADDRETEVQKNERRRKLAEKLERRAEFEQSIARAREGLESGAEPAPPGGTGTEAKQ